MRFGERIGDLNAVFRHVPGVQGSSGDRRLECLTRDELECEKQLGVVLAGLVQRRDVRMRKRCCSLRVSQKTRAPVGITCNRIVDDLERDRAAEASIARAVDLAEASGADPFEDPVVSHLRDHERATIIIGAHP